jgi:hypothetical protein
MQHDEDKQEPPLYKIENKIMGFAIHYPVSGTIKNIQWNSVNLEWEYFIKNDDGFDGKITERNILKFDQAVWEYIEARWKIYLQLLKDASEIELDVRTLLKKGKKS